MDVASASRYEPASASRPLILYVGDDHLVLDHLFKRLVSTEFVVRIVGTMSAAWQCIVQVSPFAVVIDATQPSTRWRPWELCRDLSACRRFPVIMVLGNERDDAVARSKAFEYGAEQCFSLGPGLYDDLVAYLAMWRNRQASEAGPGQGPVPASELVPPSDRIVWVDWETRQIVRGERMISLSPKELALLQLLVSRSGHVVPVCEIIKALWNRTRCAAARANLKVVVKNLRGKLEVDPKHPQFLVNVRGVGYRMRVNLKDGANYRNN